METSTIVILVLTLLFGLPTFIIIISLISGYTKSKLDDAAGSNTGWLGWIIAIMIVVAILFFSKL